MNKHEKMTRDYASWGSKLLNHADVLRGIQVFKQYHPITVQLAPTELCESACNFCSVDERPIKSAMPFELIKQCLEDFKLLGAKSVEITGGGNPMLYRKDGKDINDIITLASSLGLDVGIITNSHDLSRLKPEVFHRINWIRISLIKLDEGKNPEDYNFNEFPIEKMGFSYIIYDESTKSKFNTVTGRTTADSIKKIVQLVNLHPRIKFVRLAGNCLIKGNNVSVRQQFGDVIDAIEGNEKFFFKDIQDNDGPFDEGCHTGAIRPYIAADPSGNGDYHIYICTSHVLQKRTYDLDYSLGKVQDALEIWRRMNESLQTKGYPYEVKGNGGQGWCGTCKFCYYKHNNQLLHTVAHELPDKNFA